MAKSIRPKIKKSTTKQELKLSVFPHKVGDKVFIRTVTLYYTGEIQAIDGTWIHLSMAAWIADTGRFHQFLTEGKCNEFEGFPNGTTVPTGSIIDVTPWPHPLFVGQK